MARSPMEDSRVCPIRLTLGTGVVGGRNGCLPEGRAPGLELVSGGTGKPHQAAFFMSPLGMNQPAAGLELLLEPSHEGLVFRDTVEDSREAAVIQRRGHEDMALLPAEELSILQETAYLLRSRRMRPACSRPSGAVAGGAARGRTWRPCDVSCWGAVENGPTAEASPRDVPGRSTWCTNRCYPSGSSSAGSYWRRPCRMVSTTTRRSS